MINAKNREDIQENKILYIARFTPLKRQELALKIMRTYKRCRIDTSRI
ncbi:MAG: hypothetical protein KatS3mg003_1133 [Candidatus Nitrosocaldaceae archaeon]|nr:MAG: hypothetical protein KatS3mg003_1133 [Candidatus Nitrosocaldaceae archaeon]